jgi:hypothetical protein
VGKLRPEHVNLITWLGSPNLDVTRLGDKPIYRVFNPLQGSLIFKWEVGHTDLAGMANMTSSSYDIGFDLMKDVKAGSTAGRMVTGAELVSFCQLLLSHDLFDQNVSDVAILEGRPLFVMQDLGQSTNIDKLKISKTEGHRVKGVFVSTETNEAKADRRAAALGMLFSLKQTKYLERLGRIMAVDLFLGNTDRFDPDSADFPIPSPQNVIFKIKSKEGASGQREVYYSISGLDMNDPNGSWAKLDQDLLTCANLSGQQTLDWPGLHLNNKAFLTSYSQRVLKYLVKYLKEMLDEKKDKKKFKFKVGTSAAGGFSEDDVVNGAIAAKEQIRQTCLTRVGTNNNRAAAPAGLRSRMQALRWI